MPKGGFLDPPKGNILHAMDFRVSDYPQNARNSHPVEKRTVENPFLADHLRCGLFSEARPGFAGSNPHRCKG